jgi:hypothetical protein
VEDIPPGGFGYPASEIEEAHENLQGNSEIDGVKK